MDKTEQLVINKLDMTHPLIVLKHIIPWNIIKSLISTSLQKDNRGLSRNLDHHIRALILIMHFNCTYRELIEHLRSNIYARFFCDFQNDDASYGHTAYMKFVNELSPDVYEKINFIFLDIAKKKGLTKIKDLDVDSTVKESNITYPTDAKNLKTMMLMIHKCLNYFSKNGYQEEAAFALKFNIEKALSDFKRYFFQKDSDKKMIILSALSKRINIFIENALFAFDKIDMPKMKWYILRKLEKIKKYAKTYIKQVKHYCRTGRASANKILSFHIENVTSVQKGKEHKKYEFGEVWQVGRLDGNFCFGMFNPFDLRFHDSTALKDVIEALIVHTDDIPETVAADRGYCSDDNFNTIESLGISEQGIHPKGKKPWRITDSERATEFINRRAGIEPIIGHLKKLGLGKSQMKTDIGTRAEGARSFISFNIRKLLYALI